MLVAFGGAAPLHAAELAKRVGVPRVLIPPDPGTLSARGILVADVRKDTSRSVLRRGGAADLAELEPLFADLEAAARAELADEGFFSARVSVERTIDARYAGQSYELAVPAISNWAASFHSAHHQRFGFKREDAQVEAVTLRVSARARVTRPGERPPPGTRPGGPTGDVLVYLGGRWVNVPLYRRHALGAGQRVTGPTIIAEYSATTWLPAGWSAEMRDTGDLMLEPVGG